MFSIYHGYLNEEETVAIHLPKKESIIKLKANYICSFEEDICSISFIGAEHMLYGLKTRLLIYKRLKNNR